MQLAGRSESANGRGLGGPGLRVACFATLGSGSWEEGRIVQLLAPLNPEVWPFDRSRKRASGLELFRRGVASRPDLVVMEGSGTAGGAAVMALRNRGIPYLISSGDAIAPFLRAYNRALGPVALAYEKAFYSRSAGFIGWTPYLVGRALTLGAPRGMSAAFWADPPAPDARSAVRARLGVPKDHIVFGIAGALNWDKRGYCYGWELVRALRDVGRDDIHVVVVGDGSGLQRLRELGARDVGRRLTFTGRVPREEVMPLLAAMDVGSLPQTVDGVGSFRYTTKISEYVAAQLPIVTARIPAAYDLDDGWMWRLPGTEPWGDRYISALVKLMETVSAEEVARRRAAIPAELAVFDLASQQRRTVSFVEETLDEWRSSHSRTVSA